MGPPQWSDVGMFIQALMLYAREMGLHTCAQEAWAMWHSTVAKHVKPPETLMLFCGVGVGYLDEGDVLTFDIEEGKKGPSAVNLKKE